jgi:hypothetical protein
LAVYGDTTIGTSDVSQDLAVHGQILVNNIECRSFGSNSENVRTLDWSGTYCEVNFTNAKQYGIRA